MEETAEMSGTGGGDSGASIMGDAIIKAGEAIGSLLYTAIYRGGTAAETNIYLTGRLERAEKRRARNIGYAVMTAVAIAIAILIIWIARKPTKK